MTRRWRLAGGPSIIDRDRDWDEVAGAVELSRAESDLMRFGPGAQILNPFIHGAG